MQWFRPIGLNHCTVGLDQKGKLPCTTKRSGQLEGSSCSFARRIFQLHSTLCSGSCKCKVACPFQRGEGESIFFCFRKSGNRLNRSSCGPKRKGSLMAWWYLLLFCYPFQVGGCGFESRLFQSSDAEMKTAFGFEPAPKRALTSVPSALTTRPRRHTKNQLTNRTCLSFAVSKENKKKIHTGIYALNNALRSELKHVFIEAAW